MATFLYRLGRASFRRRWVVAGVWTLLLVLLGLGAVGLSGQLTNAVTIPGTESQRAIDHLKETFPEAGRRRRHRPCRAHRAGGADVHRAPANQAGGGEGRRRAARRAGGRAGHRPVPDPRGLAGRHGRTDPGRLRPAGVRADRRRPEALAPARHRAAPPLTVEFGGDAITRRTGDRRHRDPRCRRRRARPGDHVRLAARRRAAAAHRARRDRHRPGGHHHGVRVHGPQRQHPGARADDRPRGRHRLRVVHRVPLPQRAGQRRRAGARRGPRGRHRRLGRGVRRAHRDRRARRADRGRHPVPRRDGRRRRAHRRGRGAGRHHAAARDARLRR